MRYATGGWLAAHLAPTQVHDSMRAPIKHPFSGRADTHGLLVLLILVCAASPACDIFSSDEEQTPTDPGSLVAEVVLLGDANMQADENGNAVFLGQVINSGGLTAQNVRVSVNIRDGSAELIDVATAATVPASIAPNQTATFRIPTNTPTALVVTRQFVIEWG